MTSNSVLEHFKTITTIPRESGHEAPMTAFLQPFAASHGLECRTDAIGNVLIIKEAAPGKENVPTLVFQGHQDMVCEKNAGVQHDFSKDPISYVIEDGWMIAKDTTLGADDGIGIAASLALLESDAPMGRIECLFTISEETGMDGAEALQEGFFSGKTLINLDSEEEGEFCIGCAGGLNTLVTFKYGTENRRDGYTRISLKIGGAQGGHSGEDINKERMNTIQQMARFLYSEIPFSFQVEDMNYDEPVWDDPGMIDEPVEEEGFFAKLQWWAWAIAGLVVLSAAGLTAKGIKKKKAKKAAKAAESEWNVFDEASENKEA